MNTHVKGHVRIIDANADHVITTVPVSLDDARQLVRAEINKYAGLEPIDARFEPVNGEPVREFDFKRTTFARL